MRLGIWMAVGILEKSSRLRTARFSLGMLHSSGLAIRGKEDAARVLRNPLPCLARDVHWLRPRSELTPRLPLWRKPLMGECAGFPLARETTAGVVFRVNRDNLAGMELTWREAGRSVGREVERFGRNGKERGRTSEGGKDICMRIGNTLAETSSLTSATTGLCTN